MDIELLGLIRARPFVALRDWTQQAPSCTASAFNGTGCWTFWKVWAPALSRWRLAVARITLVFFCLQHGHEPRLMPPLDVRPYVKVHKNDDRDVEAIARAATRPIMSFVAIKSEEQLDLQALHRARERLVTKRTRLINQGRGFLMERGIRVGTGRHVFQQELVRLVATGSADLSHRILSMWSDMMAELATINDRVEAIYTEIKALAKADAGVQRLMEIPGVGLTIASALVAVVRTGSSFAKGRDLAAWLGLVPLQITTVGEARLIGISKHGNRYLCKLFIHGPRTVLHLVRDRTSPITQWADGLKERAHVGLTWLPRDMRNRSEMLANNTIGVSRTICWPQQTNV